MRLFYITLGVVAVLTMIRVTGIWELSWGWITAPVWGTLGGAIALVIWVKSKIR